VTRIATLGLVTLLALLMAGGSVSAAQQRDRPRLDVPRFVEEAVAAGVEHRYDGGYEFFVGGGVAVFDCDEDGRPDLYLAGGTQPAGLFRNESPVGGEFRFSRVIDAAASLTEVTGAYPLDIDGDGLVDLAVLRHGEDVLLRGVGDCVFERANEAWSYDGGDAWTTAFSATWENGQAWPTLAFGTYIDHVDDQGLTQCGTNVLVRPAGSSAEPGGGSSGGSSGGFAPPTPLPPGHCALSMLFSDWDRSGRRDLRVSNDRHYYYRTGQEQLWWMGSAEPPRLYTLEDGWREVRIWGMGIASQDLTGDGFPEVYLTSIGSNRLETLGGDPSRPAFEDIAHARGVTATTPFIGRPIDPSTSWHPEFEDVNNDGRMDLYVSKGNVDAMPDTALEDPNELFLGLPGATFRRAAERAGIVNTMRTRGASLVDLNGDGLLDLVEVNRTENVSLWRNVGRGDADEPRAMGRWLAVKLEQDGPNRDAIGAWIEVRSGPLRTVREVTVGGGHAGGKLGPLHFGLGDHRRARVRVTWPDGERGAWQDVRADRAVTLVRDDPAARAQG
jgi:enediyne biosynthesis protein E4